LRVEIEIILTGGEEEEAEDLSTKAALGDLVDKVLNSD